jgi:hypothetical protein
MRVAHCDKGKERIVILDKGGIEQVASPASAVMADGPPGKGDPMNYVEPRQPSAQASAAP